MTEADDSSYCDVGEDFRVVVEAARVVACDTRPICFARCARVISRTRREADRFDQVVEPGLHGFAGLPGDQYDSNCRSGAQRRHGQNRTRLL